MPVMLLVTGAVALQRKLVDERAKRREAKQGTLEVGGSDVAKRAFASQASSINRSQPAIVKRAPTEIKYEDPNDVTATMSPSDTTSPAINSPRPEFQDARHTSQLNVASPVQSERGVQESWSPYSENASTPSDQQSLQPPPYSTRARSNSNPLRPTGSSYDTDASSLTSFDTSSGTLRSTNSNGTHAIRIKTIGSELKSGFPYHDALFELNVHPQKWTAFTTQVIEAAKLSASDQAGAWASATAVALTGAIGTSVMLGRSMTRTAQEKKIKSGLASSDSKLGERLKMWNEAYFSPRGLFVHLELSESAMKNPGQQSKALRKGVLLYSKPEDRARKREERKFVIVVTKLDEDGEPMEALTELELEQKRDEVSAISEEKPVVVEIDGSDMPSSIQELPAEQTTLPVELPADLAMSANGAFEPLDGYVEMSSDNTLLLQKMNIQDKQDADEKHSYGTNDNAHQQTTGGYGYMSAEEEKRQLEASHQASFTRQPDNDNTIVAEPPTTERSLPQHEQIQRPPSPHSNNDSRNQTQTQPETAGVNAYTLESVPDSNQDERERTTAHESQSHSSLTPQPLSVQASKGVALYDGAEWGGDDDFA